ncbi:MAG: hypothetical protein HRU34_05235 [Richelia sp.]|nr:hypothetical protein [Richelia sp.]
MEIWCEKFNTTFGYAPLVGILIRLHSRIAVE